MPASDATSQGLHMAQSYCTLTFILMNRRNRMAFWINDQNTVRQTANCALLNCQSTTACCYNLRYLIKHCKHKTQHKMGNTEAKTGYMFTQKTSENIRLYTAQHSCHYQTSIMRDFNGAKTTKHTLHTVVPKLFRFERRPALFHCHHT